MCFVVCANCNSSKQFLDMVHRMHEPETDSRRQHGHGRVVTESLAAWPGAELSQLPYYGHDQ